MKQLHRAQVAFLLRLGLAVILCIGIGGESVSFCAADQDTIQALEARQGELKRQKSSFQKKLDGLAQSKGEALNKKGLLEQKANVLEEEIQLSQQMIETLDRQIKEKEGDLRQAQQEEAAYHPRFCQRVREMEERGKVSYWAILFHANSFSDFLDQLNMVAEIVDYDNRVMDQLDRAKQAVAQAKAGLEQSRQDRLAALNGQIAQRKELREERDQVEQLIAEIETQRAVYGQQITALEAGEDRVAEDLARAEAAYAQELEREKKEVQRRRAETLSPSSVGDPQRASVTEGLLWPVPSSYRVTSPFGPRTHPITGRPNFHRGIDIAAPYGEAVVASQGGVVVISRYHSSYGNYIVVAHPNGMRTLYAHLSERLFAAGASVSQGQTIGRIGSTGSSTGNHLHYETWTGSSSGSRVDPMQFF